MYGWLTEEGAARAFGEVTGFHDGNAPYVDIDIVSGAYPQSAPAGADGLCYATATDGTELCMFMEYNMPTTDGILVARIIDEDIRGMTEEQLFELLFELDGSRHPLALIPA